MRRFLATTLISGLFLAACGGGDEDATAAETTAAPAATEATDSQTSEGPNVVAAPEGSLAANPMFLGDADAPVTIVEYASVTCPACASFHEHIFPEIKEKFVDTGKVRFEFREFPTNPQNLAYAGFYLARCSATTKGSTAYFKMLETLFEQQRDWAYGPTPGESLQNIAAQAGINKDGLADCFKREDVKTAVKNNVTQGLEENVNATPTFMIDGEPLEWKRGSETMVEAIERELAKRS